MRTLPDGLMVLAAATAVTTSSGDMSVGAQAVGLTRTTMVRALPPKGGGAETPAGSRRAAAPGSARGPASRPRVLVSLVKTRSPTGTLPASKRMTNGGTVPGGMKARARFT